MRVVKKDLIITDPCYFAKDEDWGNSIDYDDFIINNKHFSQYEWEDTGYGDGSPKIFSIPSYYNPNDYLDKLEEDDDEEVRDSLLYLRKNIGECGVDSGTFGVFILEEVLNYNSEFIETLPKNCYCIINNFTGLIYSSTDSNGFTHFILKPDNSKEQPILTD